MNAYVVIADAANPVASGIVAFFLGTNAQSNAVAWRDANKPGFGVVPANVPSATVFNGVNVTIP